MLETQKTHRTNSTNGQQEEGDLDCSVTFSGILETDKGKEIPVGKQKYFSDMHGNGVHLLFGFFSFQRNTYFMRTQVPEGLLQCFIFLCCIVSDPREFFRHFKRVKREVSCSSLNMTNVADSTGSRMSLCTCFVGKKVSGKHTYGQVPKPHL